MGDLFDLTRQEWQSIKLIWAVQRRNMTCMTTDSALESISLAALMAKNRVEYQCVVGFLADFGPCQELRASRP